ncbi:hypothetical protein GCM10008995_18250 [Halobellus salinus]|uniref:Gluconate 2-dehydrogenase subunit 3 family protein n=1 Tax=Halobellus salinus TaxID=931585 RepID=A0A830ENN6_9EURY|nr:gluconate 2-dehydrogenase subunit 3 family protein [Halobellus salinus]GGJ08754.1 hypothetical protein GCM10008995_18250 [Halobellus salinus]SMP28452.1 Gluconate 2-dehydrogenase subunit 3 [Halobellus salinus]
MELTRRDAVAALAAVGVTVGGGVLAGRFDPPRADRVSHDSDGGAGTEVSLSTGVLDLLDAAAEVVYPDGVENRRSFVESYVVGRVAERPTYRAGLREAAAQLDAVARDWHDTPYADLDADTRDRLLRELGVETADPDPEGPISDRIRFYVVNDLLFAFYSSPAGGRLVGIENPTGHPGGIESYQQGSMPSGREGSGGANER